MSRKKKYKTPQGRPRSVPPGLTDKTVKPIEPPLADVLDDHPYAPGGHPYNRPASTAYGRAVRKIYERMGLDMNELPGPWIALGELRRELNCTERTLQHVVANMTNSGRWEVEANLFRALAPVRIRQSSNRPRTRRPQTDEALAIEFVRSIQSKVQEQTGIDVTVAQALNWFRNKLMAYPDLMC
jgi:hypothetical protein